ncbi:nucleotidyl transferase AbiEii/AbiGii toxin family protein [Flavobacteriaceae bacterium F89]|uniref:Nucleotidyl transferase AbiEii/AbiGii toxin family protein n=1 Tax=Cerina litoralis TaxID=2874477 RepID=A0AAE3EZR9_9FLAO|nr:nucleotidyl transferase AbiEii/AbiGii toxin family protein [Cerina litoralis]MCG2462667.1 nucleotidyl transferase AbiEii/AbiGii toxin family protein [Cerina litoralis]
MILPESLHIEWINSKTSEFQADPIIIEKVIRALSLLESLKSADLDFIFKGGTSLVLIIQEPRRFSIDLDIIITDKSQNIGDVLERVVASTDFISWEEQKRNAASTIEKRHFKIFYRPQVKMRGDTNIILLDIVFAENPYVSTRETNVSHFLLSEEGSPVIVTTPTLPAILGDKLTAFGPNTTGVPMTKPMDVLKQVYDIACIADRLSVLDGVRENFIKVAKAELAYKGLDPDNFQPIIDDIVSSSFNFCTYGKVDKISYSTMQSGVSKLSSYIYGPKFREAQAQIAMAKASYIVKQIEKNSTKIEHYEKGTDMLEWVIGDHYYSGLNKLKKHNLEAFHYWHKIFGLNR